MDKKEYVDLAVEASLPISQRPESVKTRSGKMARVRRFHMSMDDQKDFRKQSKEAGRFIAPYRTGGYWAIIEALSQLGENQEHKFSDFWTKFVEIMSDEKLQDKYGKTLWESFSGRPLRSPVTGKNVIDKVHQNIRVLQRLGGTTPYGLKLAQLNACIDVLGTQNDIRLRLRTGIPHGESVIPLREIRKKSFTPTEFIPAGYSVAEGVDGGTSMAVAVESAISAAEASVQEDSPVEEEISLGNDQG